MHIIFHVIHVMYRTILFKLTRAHHLDNQNKKGLIKYSLLLIPFLIPAMTVNANENLDEYCRDLVVNGIDSVSLNRQTAVYQGLRENGVVPRHCYDWYKAASTILAAEAGIKSRLYSPSILVDLENTKKSCPQPESSWWNFILGNAYYVSHDFKKAALTYARVQPNSEDEGALSIYLTAQFNLASAFHGMEDIQSAIQIMKELADYTEQVKAELATEDIKRFHQKLQVNLGGMLVSAHDYADAQLIFQSLAESDLEPYWEGIVAMNKLLIYQETGDFEKADSMWVNSVSAIDYQFIPSNSVLPFMRQTLMSDDVAGFKALSNYVIRSESDLPADPDFPYGPLIEASLDPGAFAELWKRFRTWERERAKFVGQCLDYQNQINAQNINAFRSELSKRDESVDFWRGFLGFFIILIVSILISYVMVKRERIKSSKRELEAVLAKSANARERQTLNLKMDDVRTLGDAITQGKRTGDAMLILEKMSLSLMPSPHILTDNIESIESYEDLTNSEKKILKHLISGFDAKEIARMLKVSPSHVYNSRSHIRRKLDIPRSATIEDWVLSNAVKAKMQER